LNATSSLSSPSKCTKIVGCWGFAPEPTVGAYSAPITHSWIKGATSKGRVKGGRGRKANRSK